MGKKCLVLRRCKYISRGHLLQEFFKINDGILMSEFLNNSNQKNQIDFHNFFIIPLLCTSFTKVRSSVFISIIFQLLNLDFCQRVDGSGISD